MCNKLLCLLMLVFVIAGAAVAGTAEPNLVAWYRFDDGSGTTAHDYSGNGYNGTVGSSSGWNSTGFYGNGCLYFNGTFNVAVPSAVVSGLSDEVTVSVWVNSDNPGTYANALFWGTDSSHNRVLGVELPGSYNSHLWFHAGSVSGSCDTYTYYNIANAVTFRGQWNNFTFTKNTVTGEMKIYVNGILLGTETSKTKTMANMVNFKIGTSWDGTWGLKGKMADFKIFDRVLSAAEISEQAGNSLVAWWKFEETSGTIARDSSSYRHDGTLGNNNSWDGGIVFTGDDYGASKVGFTSADASGIFSTVDNQVTVAFWAKNDFDHDSGNNGVFTGKNSSGTTLLRVELPTGSGGDLVFKAGNNDCIYSWGINDSGNHNYLDMEHWHHYVLVKDAALSYMKVYIDGYLADHITGRYDWQGGGSLTASMAGIVNFEFCGNSSNWSQFAGTVRDFRIYDTAVEPLDVRDIYNQYAVEFNNTYYVDAVYGNDSYNGKSPAAAWKNISKLNATTFQPLDRILLKAGCTWTGAWTLKGSGNPGEPIVVDAYGDVSNQNNKPRINNTSTWEPTITANNVQWWEVNNLHLTHHPAARTQWISAVRINADNFGKMNHIYIKDCYIHDVYGMLEVYGGGAGVSMGCNEQGATESWLNDILIEGCYFETVDSTAIHGGSNPADGDRQPATHVVVRDNFFTDIGESAIVMICDEGALVEYNVLTQCFKRGGGGCGIWPFASNNTIVQYNEVYDCDDRGDGEAYDCDYQCDGTIFQYNYSHDNPGGFMRICCNEGDGNYNTNNTIRYNISINDGDYDDAVIELWKKVVNTKIYNNIIYLENKGTVDMVSSNRYGGGSGASHYWWNNIWVAVDDSIGRFAIDDGSSNTWSNNCFYGDFKVGHTIWLFDRIWVFSNGTPSGANKTTSNPKFVNPGEHNIGSSLMGYQLQSTSPCIGTGMNISNNGGLDYWGNHTPNGTTDRGAHERP